MTSNNEIITKIKDPLIIIATYLNASRSFGYRQTCKILNEVFFLCKEELPLSPYESQRFKGAKNLSRKFQDFLIERNSSEKEEWVIGFDRDDLILINDSYMKKLSKSKRTGKCHNIMTNSKNTVRRVYYAFNIYTNEALFKDMIKQQDNNSLTWIITCFIKHGVPVRKDFVFSSLADDFKETFVFTNQEVIEFFTSEKKGMEIMDEMYKKRSMRMYNLMPISTTEAKSLSEKIVNECEGYFFIIVFKKILQDLENDSSNSRIVFIAYTADECVRD